MSSSQTYAKINLLNRIIFHLIIAVLFLIPKETLSQTTILVDSGATYNNTDGPSGPDVYSVNVSNCTSVSYSLAYSFSVPWEGDGNLESSDECGSFGECIGDPNNPTFGQCANCWDFLWTRFNLDGVVVGSDLIGDVGTNNTEQSGNISFGPVCTNGATTADITMVSQTWTTNESVSFTNLMIVCWEGAPTIAATGSTPCTGEDLPLNGSVVDDSVISDWSWNTTGSGTISNSTSQNTTLANGQNGDIYSLTTTDINGCTATDFAIATFLSTDNANDPDIIECGSDPTNIDLTPYDLDVHPTANIIWYDGDPSTGGTTIPDPTNVNLNNIGDLWAGGIENGCNLIPVDVTIIIQPQTTPTSFSIFDICLNSLFFNLTALNPSININSNTIIQWYDGDPSAGGIPFGDPSTANPANLGNLWVSATLNGCTSNLMIPTTFIEPTITSASSNSNTICAGEIVDLFSTAIDNAGVIWDNNGGDGSFTNPNANNPSYEPGPLEIINGSITLTVSTTNNGGCPDDTSDPIIIDISPGATAMITGDAEICGNSAAMLDAGSTDGSNTILWTTVFPSDGSFTVDNNNNTNYTPGPDDIINGSATVMVTVTNTSGLCLPSPDMFTINILPAPTAMIQVPDPVGCEGEMIFVFVDATNNNGVEWSSTGDGVFDDISNPNTFYTPGPTDGENGTVRIAIVIPSGNNCPSAPGNFDLTVIPAPEVSAIGDLNICAGSTITLFADLDGSNNGPSWTANPGGGTFSDANIQNPVYTPSQADIDNGSVTFTVTTSDPSGICPDPLPANHTTTIEAGATVMAGDNQIICEGNTVLLDAILSDPINNTITWSTSGNGSFNFDNVSNPIYTPSETDISNGSVVLTASTQSSNPNCNTPATDEVDITITPAPAVTVGNAQSICSGSSTAPLGSTISGSATSFEWSTDGDGSFDPNMDDPNAIYIPGTNDLISQSVTITATTDNPNSACSPAVETIDITITNAPSVIVGNDITICQDDAVTLAAMLVAPATSLTWSTSGDGNFLPVGDPNAVYTPGPNDLDNLTTPIILTATTDDVNGTCTPGMDSLTVKLDEAPIIDLGPDLTSCADDDVNLMADLDGSATTIFWSTGGDGTFNEEDITDPTYSPSADDIANGSVTLTAITDNGGGECDPASDEITITFSTAGDASFSYPVIGCTNGSNPAPDVAPSGPGSFSVNNSGDIDAMTGEFLISSAIIGDTYTITYISTGNCPGTFTQDIMIVGPDDPSFGYTTTSCITDANPVPSSTSGTDGNFSVDGGASIDPLTGELDLASVTAGENYLITFLSTGDCPAPASAMITIFGSPEAGDPTGPIAVCNMGSAIIDLETLLDDEDAGGTWTDISTPPTDGFNVDTFDPNNQAGGTYTFRYTVPANGPCSEEFAEVSVTVEAQETAILDPIILMPCSDNNGSNISVVNFNDLVLSTSVPGTWEDTDMTGVNLGDLNNVDFDGISAGFYTFTYTLPATTNCPQAPTYTTQVEVVSCNCPAVQNTITASTCEGTPFIWNSIPYFVADTYVQTFPGEAASGCDSTDVIVLTVIELPTINVGDNFIICEGDDIPLDAMIGGSADSIIWSVTDIGDGSFNNENSLTPVYMPGPNDVITGFVDLTGTTIGMTCDPVTDNIRINMLSPQDASFVYPDNACLGGTNPEPSTSPFPSGTYTVDSGASIDANSGVLDLTTTTAGQSYNITFTSNGTCPGTATETINIIDNPDAGTAAAPAEICNDNPSSFDLNTLLIGAETGGTWTETTTPPSSGLVGDNFNGNGQDAGNYTFQYTVSGANCPDASTEVMIIVSEPITATVTPSGNICNNTNNSNNAILNFNDLITDGATNGTWTDGGSGVDLSNPANVSFDGVIADTYTFTYTTPANGTCPGQSYNTSIIVEDCLCPSIIGNPETYDGCQGDNFEVTVNGTLYNQANPTGTEFFTSFNTGCDSIVDVNLNYAIPPNAGTAAAPIESCNENSTLIDLNTLLIGAETGGTWTETTPIPSTGLSGNNFNSNGQNVGTYIFTYTLTSANCPDQSTDVFVNVNEPLTATVTPSGNICNNTGNGNDPIFNFNDLVTAGATNGIWTDGGSGVNLDDPANVSFDGIVANTYTFTYTTPANGSCPGQSYTTSIIVEDCFCPSIIGDPETYDGCQGDNFEVTVNGTLYNQANPTGTEFFTSFNTGCDSIVDVVLNYAIPPNAGTAAPPTEICNDNPTLIDLNTLLIGAETGGTWTETTPIPSTGLADNNFNSNGQNAGTYIFTYTLTSLNCPDQSTDVFVQVDEPLTATVTPSGSICNNTIDGNNPIFNFNDLITEGPTNGIWTDNLSGATATNPTNVSFDGIPADTYNFTYTTPTNACPGQAYTTSILVEDCLCPTVFGSETYSGCQGDGYSVVVGTQTFDEDNPTGNPVLMAASGCDSIVNVDLMFATPPNAGIAGTPTEGCNDGGSIINLNSLLTGAETGGVWTETTSTPSTGLSGNQFNPDGQLIGIYTFLYTVNGTNCPNASTEVFVEVTAGNTATLDPLTQVCNSTANGNITTIDFNSIITAGDANGTWVDTEGIGVNLSNLSSVDFANIPIGTYTFTYTTTDAGNCPGQDYEIEILVRDCACTGSNRTESYMGCTGDGFTIVVNENIYNESNPTGTEIMLNEMNCDSIVNIELSFSTEPTIEAGDDLFVCVGEPINLTAVIGGAATTVTWSSTGDGNFDDNQSLNPVYTPGTTDINNGFVSIIAIADNGGTTCTPPDPDIFTINFVNGLTGSISGDNTVCAGESAEISFDLSGGTLYNITYSDGTNTFNEVGIPDGFTTMVNPSINTTYTLESLTAIDNTCLATIPNSSVMITVTEISTTAFVSNEFDGFGVSCNGSSDGEITVTTVLGTPPFSYEWSNGSTSSVTSNLGAGFYTITVTDAIGCSEELSATITEPSPINLVASTVSPECFGDNDGVISIDTITGGNGPYAFSIDDNTPSVVNSFPAFIPFLEAGNYDITLQDSEGCETETSVSIAAPMEYTADLGRDTTILLGDSIELEVLFNDFLVDSILWTSTFGDACTSCTAQYVRPNSTSLYTVYAADSLGCSTTTELLVTVDKPRRVYIPNAFSPNGDGTNDRFYVNASTEVERITKFSVFDRWGELVFNADGSLPNDPRFGWNGELKSKSLNSAVFVYMIEVLFVDGERKLYSGDVTLVR